MFEEPAHTRGEVPNIICNVNYDLEEKKATDECWRSLCRQVPVQTHFYRGVGTADFSAKAKDHSTNTTELLQQLTSFDPP